MRHPMQKIDLDERGLTRFRENAVVVWLLENGGLDMNAIARQGFEKPELRQFVQLIGYSTSGYGSLSYAQGSNSANIADEIAEKMMGK